MTAPPSPVRPNWLLLSLLGAAGLALGLLPYLVWAGTAGWALGVFVVALVLVPLIGRKFVSAATERPRPLEWLLAGWSAVAYGATAGLGCLVWYGIAWGLVRLLDAGAGWLGWELGWHAGTVAQWVGGTILVLLGLGMPAAIAEELPAKLYPNVAGARSAFHALASHRWRIAAVAALVVLALAAALAWLAPGSLALAVLASLVLLVSAAPLMAIDAPGRARARPGVDERELVAAAFRAAGYRVVPRPRTGQADVDPLIASVDLLARGATHGYAVEVSLPDAKDAAVDWPAAARLRAASRVLERALRSTDGQDIRIDPCLVLIGGRAGDDLLAFAGEEGVRLASFESAAALQAALGRAAGGGVPAELARLLGVEAADAADRAATGAARAEVLR